ncbi:site-2 protease family protein [Halomonas cupida]|uniref:site-2 protease family protein n=1 Tax=Halomonas cupida TaxID=44933 RepID=UPI003EF0EB37
MPTIVAPEGPGQQPLPELRPDLRLSQSTPDEDGAPMWTLFDPLRGLYFHLHLQGLRLIQLWRHCATTGELTQRANAAGASVEHEDVEGLVKFLTANHLTVARSPEDSERLARVDASQRVSPGSWILHHYLFFRVPLVRPDRRLSKWLPLARPLVSPVARWMLLLLAVLGGYFVIRQWDDFVGTLMRFLSWDGLLWYGLALIGVKSAHELGHALVAKHYGCRVATMGVAFLVMIPMLYTDATDTWRLKNDRDRLRVAMAGVMMELSIAVIATVAWGLLPDGPLRQAAFFLATTSWITSLLINLSPFMRFDGYHALSDLWGIRNLQPRAFAVTRWWLRETLFGFGEPPPESFTSRRRRALVIYSIGTWIYRFFLFLGIALLVYNFAFKVLGIVLFLVEICWFILRPIINEVREVSQRRIPLNLRTVTTLLLALALLAVLFVPWRGVVSLPAVLEASAHVSIYPPEPARLDRIEVTQDEQVTQGQVLYVLEQPEIDLGVSQARRRIDVVEARLARRAGSAEDLAQQGVLRTQLAELQAQVMGLQARQQALTVRAPFSGRMDIVEDLHAGRWLGSDTHLANLVTDDSTRAYGFVAEQDLARLEPGQRGLFIPDDGDHASVEVIVRAIDKVGAERLVYPGLASTYGGPLPVSPKPRDSDSSGQPRLEDGIYRVAFTPRPDFSIEDWQIYGQVAVDGPTESLAGAIFRHAASVMIRESGF